MSSEARLYTISPQTRDALRKFRLGTSRAKEPQAVIYQIDRQTTEILPSTPPKTYTSLPDLADALPDNSPRYILLSYPLVLASGRPSVPYTLLSYLPPTCCAEQRMLYAGARELMRSTAEASRVVEVESGEEVEGVEGRLRGEE